MQMDDTTLTITQKRFLRGRLTLTLDGGKLRSESRQGLSLHEYRFDLRGLLPDPIRTKHVPIGKIVGALLVLGLSVPCFGWAICAGERDRAGHFTLAGALLVLGFALSILAARQTVNAVVFRGPGGQVILWPGLPSREQFDRFMAVLIERIRGAQDYEQILLQRLRQADIINDWQYDQAAELLRRNDHPEAS
jgi:hypothetical protein